VGRWATESAAGQATARELRRLSLADALELTALITLRDRRLHRRVAARWFVRYLEDRDGATIEEAAMIVACLASLGGYGHEAALQTLRA